MGFKTTSIYTFWLLFLIVKVGIGVYLEDCIQGFYKEGVFWKSWDVSWKTWTDNTPCTPVNACANDEYYDATTEMWRSCNGSWK